jgi:Flp pilus assembly protein TadD
MQVKRSIRILAGWTLGALGIILLLHALRSGRTGDARASGPGPSGGGESIPAGKAYQALLYDVPAWSFSKSELARLDDQIGEMSRMGFRPVTAADIRRFLDAGQPLPAKAVMLLFSGLRHEQIQPVREVMDRRRWGFSVTLAPGSYKDANTIAALQSAPPSGWCLGMRWEDSADLTWMDEWTAIPPQFAKALFAHRTFPLRDDTVTPEEPLVFGGMDIGYSNGDVPRDRQNLLKVPPTWIGRDLVGHLVEEWSAMEDASGTGVAWAIHSGLAGMLHGRMWLRSPANGIPAEIGPAAPAPGISCRVAFDFEEYPSGLSLRFAPGPVTDAGVLVFDPNGQVRIEARDAQGVLQSDTEAIPAHPVAKLRLEVTVNPGRWLVAVNGRPLLARGIPMVGGLDSRSLSIVLAPPAAGEARVECQLQVSRLESDASRLAPRVSDPPQAAPGAAPGTPQEDEGPLTASAALVPGTQPSVKSLDHIRADAESALAAGKPVEALKRFGEWWMSDPDNVQPVERMAEVLVQIDRKHEAIDFYRQALDLDPGRESLALRLSGLLQEVGRGEDARLVLNDYGRLHPNSTEILMAQAEWLQAHGRNAEAAERAGRVAELDPANLRAVLLLLSGQSDAGVRRKNVARLIEHLAKTGLDESLLDVLYRRSILTIPEAPELWVALQAEAARTGGKAISSRLTGMSARRGTDGNGMATGELSADWVCWDGETVADKDGASAVVQARPTAMECTVRARHSDRWLDGAIEVEASAVGGGLWLLARKSTDHVVRFGFDRQEGRILLQTWTGGGATLLVNQRIDLPAGFFEKKHVYRLECKGNGVVAYLDGKPVVAVPESCPSTWQGGWFGMVFRADEPGVAGARIHRLVANSMSPRLAVFPAEISETAVGAELELVRELASAANVVSPVLFTVDENGAFSSPIGLDTGFVRLLAKYHKLRYMPGVKWRGATMPDADALADLAVLHVVDGIVLHLAEQPSGAWMTEARKAFQSRGAGLLCVIHPAGSDTAKFYATFGLEMIPEPVVAVVAGVGKTDVADGAGAVLLRLKENY